MPSLLLNNNDVNNDNNEVVSLIVDYEIVDEV